LSASYAVSGGVSRYDWIGLFTVGQVIVSSDGTDEALWWTYVSRSSSSGTISTFSNSQSSRWSVPAAGGPFEFRYFCCDSVSLLGKSAPISISSSAPGDSLYLYYIIPHSILPNILLFIFCAVTMTSVPYASRFDTLSASWTRSSPSSRYDWIGLYSSGAISGTASYLWFTYVSTGSTSGTVSTSSSLYYRAWRVPYSSGSYEFRYFCCGSYSLQGVSNTITISDSTGGPSRAPVTATPTATAIPTALPTPLPPTSSGSSGVTISITYFMRQNN